MNGIIGMSHLALQTKLTDKQKNYLQKIDGSAKSLLGILNDILDISKIEAGKLSIETIDVDLFETVDQVINFVELSAHQKNLELIVIYSVDIGRYYKGDSLRLMQVLTNLIGNAIKFTERGRIILRIDKVQKNRLRFEVKDTGIGLSKEQQEKLFQSFSQADESTTRKFGGTGLGLSISKNLVELMKGKIYAKSEIGVGSSFIFEIELIEDTEQLEVFRKFEHKKVLLIDNDHEEHAALKNTLEHFDLDVDSASSAEEMSILLEQCQNSYDLILIDWNLHQSNGVKIASDINRSCSLCEHIGNCQRQLPPMIMMANHYNQEIIIEDAKQEGIELFVHKPINPSLLNDLLSNLFSNKTPASFTKKYPEKTLKNNLTTLQESHILLVEDNSINQEIILGLLEESGIKLDIAHNGQEAIDKYTQNQDRYSLILMDIQMPIMDGYEAAKAIRKNNLEIPIVALTANAMKEDTKKSEAAGMNGHLNKPVEIEKLYQTLLKYIPHKINIPTTSTDSSDEIHFPKFINIDTNIGLYYCGNNKNLYLSILRDFNKKYIDINLNLLDDSEFERFIHTLKGLSLAIGATFLHTVVKTLNTTYDKTLIPILSEQLLKVITELQDYFTKIDLIETALVPLADEEKERLFIRLKEYASRRRLRQCDEILKELTQSKLSNDERILVKTLQSLSSERDYKAIMELIDEQTKNTNR